MNDQGWVIEHEAKEKIIQEHFAHAMRRGDRSTKDFNWEELNLEKHELQGLDSPFTEKEVIEAINDMPSDKAPGLDGFTGAFFKKCWDTMRHDLMRAIDRFDSLHSTNLHWINSANIVLLPKKEGAERVADYRPISLIHAIARIIAKMLSIRLGPHMSTLISNAQSAFIKTRSIHDNFMYVRNLARRLHKCKTPSLLFKLDIRKAFDLVRWEYLLDLLERRGFPSKFRDWIAALWCSSSSRVLLNGVAGTPMKHGSGLRQGDPISPLLFVIAIDPLQRILNVATRKGMLHKIRGRGAMVQTSLYADDAALFMAPIKRDIDNLAAILRGFGEVTGLSTNFCGLGMLNTKKFARALRLRWPWFEWKEPCKLWVGHGNPCDAEDLDFFYASTTITVGNGARTPFWDSPWLLGRKPKDIAPLIFEASSRKNWKVREALRNNAWILRIKPPSAVVSAEHIRQLFSLWMLLDEVLLDELTDDDISWKHMASGQYTSASAYKAQFLGVVLSPMDQMVWKAWAPLKVKFFAWLALQDRIWTADRLAKRGWPNCGPCPLCKGVQECGPHILFKCRYSLRLWRLVIQRFGIDDMDTTSWHLMDSVESWWVSTCDVGTTDRKAKASITILVSWVIWNERNARVFRHKSAPPPILLNSIVDEASL
ncbi:uncharacterized protein [Aegilops tauschii subsp. strangulata]|uniref:uncharacterized protein n=1 Tax=Aegilops tauschii subsp. strangulata TaxID=200361 RepID=UPI001ABC6C0A